MWSPTSTDAATHPPFRLREERNFVHQRGVSRFDLIRRMFKIYEKIAGCPAKHCIILSMNAAPEMILAMGQTAF